MEISLKPPKKHIAKTYYYDFFFLYKTFNQETLLNPPVMNNKYTWMYLKYISVMLSIHFHIHMLNKIA